MNLAAPWWLLLWLPVAALVAIALFGGALHHRRLRRVFRGDLFHRVLPRSVRLRRYLALALATMGLILAVFASAEPRFDKEIKTIKARGVDLVLVVDLSLSMDARDVQPSRLERAKREISDLLDIAVGDRVGLVVFAGGPFVATPLTQDHRAVELQVQELSTALFQTQGSELGAAIRAASRLLSNDSKAGKGILILSDGEIHDVGDAATAASEMVQKGVVLYAMGIGSDPAYIPRRDGTYVTDRGQTVLSTPNPAILMELARTTGGAFVQSIAAASDMEKLYQNEMRQKLRAVERGAVQREQWRSAYQWPLAVGLLLLLAAAWLGDGRRFWGAAAVVLLACLLLPSKSWAASEALGDAYYREGRFREAVEEFTELSLEYHDNPRIFDRLGAARYRNHDYSGAARAWEQRNVLLGGEADSLFDAGNAYYQAGRLDEALERYEAALTLEEGHQGARQNREILVRELESRLQDQPQPQQPESPDQQGQPQQGDKSNNGERQEGGDKAKSGSQGSPGESESSPSATGEADEGDPQAAEEASSEGQDSESRNGSDVSSGQEKQGNEGSSEAVDPARLEGGTPQEAESGAEAEMSGAMSRQEAERLLEGVEEGRPRVTLAGGSGSRPW